MRSVTREKLAAVLAEQAANGDPLANQALRFINDNR